MPEKRRLFRPFVYTALVILLIVVVGVRLLGVYLEGRILAALKDTVNSATKGEYSFSADELSIHFLERSVTFENLVLAPVAKNYSGKAQYVVKAGALRINGISIMPFLRTKDLQIHNITFEDPQISIFQGLKKLPVQKKEEDRTFSLFQIIAPKLHSLSIEEINIFSSRFNVYRNREDTVSLLSAKENTISIRKLVVNEETDKAHRLFFAEKFDIVMNEFSYHLKEGLYTLFGKKLYASYTDSVITVDSFQLVPNYSKKDFAKAAERQISRVDAIFSKVGFSGIDVKLFLELNWLVAEKLTLEKSIINVYRDNNAPLAPIIRPSLQSVIRDLPFYISIDTVILKDGAAVVESIAEGASTPGTMSLDGINGTITGIQNDSTLFTDKSAVKASLDAIFLKTGKFHADYIFPINTRKELCYCSGTLSSLPMQMMNSLIVSAKGFAIKSGNLDSMRYSFVAKDNLSTGKMTLAYHNLTVEEVSSDGKNSLKSKLRNLAANELILIRSNPGKDGVLRTVNIRAERNPYRYFPYLFMRSLTSGITASIEGEKKSNFLKRTHLLDKK